MTLEAMPLRAMHFQQIALWLIANTAQVL